jgi:hypothetical protein
MDIGATIGAILPYAMGFIMIFVIYIMVRKMLGNFRPKDKLAPPSTTGERLKKYLHNSRKGNPKVVKEIYMKRTPFNAGGWIGHCVAVLPTRHCTRFIFKQHWWQTHSYQLMYCPTSMHTSLHSTDVMIGGVGLDNAGGFYYPIPSDETLNYSVFKIVSDAVKIDIKKMQIIDTIQVEYDQVMSAIAGKATSDEFIEMSPEDMVERQPQPEEVSTDGGG